MKGKKYLEELLSNKFVIEEYKNEINEYVDNLEQQVKNQKEVIDMFLEKVDKNKKLLNNPELLDLYLKIKEVSE